MNQLHTKALIQRARKEITESLDSPTEELATTVATWKQIIEDYATILDTIRDIEPAVGKPQFLS